MDSIHEDQIGSHALQLIQSKGWNWKQSTTGQIELETCPYCSKTGYGHFYIELHGPNDERANRDGLHTCHRCGTGGSLYDLKKHLGIVKPGIESRKEWSDKDRKIEELPDVEACHQLLLSDEAAMDYLINGRGFSREIIQQQKIGLVAKRYFKETGEVRSLVYPYLVNGNTVFVHYRTLPTMPLSSNKVTKAFSSPMGWDVPLYNGEALNEPGLKEITFVEGEPNTIAALDKGIFGVCGVPGANIKKAEWIDQLDKLERIYIAYDKDKVGQKAAQALAARLGVEKCWKIILPDFEVVTEEGTTRKGKDLNEWFVQGGGNAEEFHKLKEQAELFDVDGVTSAKDAVQEFMDELEGKESLEPKYKTRWASLNKLVGFDDGDIIDISAEEKTGKTTFAINLLEDMVEVYGEDGLFICLEMTRAKMARKWIAYKGQVADNIPDPDKPEQAVALLNKFKKAIPEVMEKVANREGNIYFAYPKYKTEDDVYNLMRDCIRRYGVKWIVIDNIQRLCDSTIGDRNRTQFLSQISKVTSQIAKDYGVQMIRILQPNRVPAGKIVSVGNTDGSSQIAKDCDCTILLHREKLGELSQDSLKAAGGLVQMETSMSDNMVVLVPISRYSGGGGCTLHYNGATSTVSELTMGQILKMQADAVPVGYDGINNSLKIVSSIVKGEGVNLSASPATDIGEDVQL